VADLPDKLTLAQNRDFEPFDLILLVMRRS